MPSQTELLTELTTLLDAQAELPAPTEGSYANWIGRKSNWVPAQYAKQSLPTPPSLTHKAIEKCLALALELEVPVGLYTLEASRREFTPAQRWALLDNSSDEINHYNALSNWARSYTPGLPQEYLHEARVIREALQDVPEHPVLKSGYVELGIFFVVLSILRKFGGTSLKMLGNDISRDEAQHVLVNWAVIDEQAIPYSTSVLNKFRRDVVAWLTSDIKSRDLSQSFWLDQSDRLIATRQADGLDFTKHGQYVAFFEISNESMASY